MIYRLPTLQLIDQAVIVLIGDLRERLKVYERTNPRRWHGSLRRNMFARAIRGSNTIEGYTADLDTAVAVVEDEPPLDGKTETILALGGYRDALTYITLAARDPHYQFSKQFLKSLHFMMTGFDLSKFPGQWRPGPIFVVDQDKGATVYEAPDQMATQYWFGYRFTVGLRLVHCGITTDPTRREMEHRQRWAYGTLTVVTGPMTEQQARAWEALQPLTITPERR